MFVLHMVDLIDDAEQMQVTDADPDFLADLAHHRVGDRLGPFHLAAGQAPMAGLGRHAPLHQQQLAALEDRGTATDLGMALGLGHPGRRRHRIGKIISHGGLQP